MNPQLLWYQECKRCAIMIFGDEGETRLPFRSWERPRSLSEPAPRSPSSLGVSGGAPTCAAPSVTPRRTVFVRKRGRCVSALAGEPVTVGRLWPAQPALAGLYSGSCLCNGTPRLQTSFPTFSVGELKEQPSQRNRVSS